MQIKIYNSINKGTIRDTRQLVLNLLQVLYFIHFMHLALYAPSSLCTVSCQPILQKIRNLDLITNIS